MKCSHPPHSRPRVCCRRVAAVFSSPSSSTTELEGRKKTLKHQDFVFSSRGTVRRHPAKLDCDRPPLVLRSSRLIRAAEREAACESSAEGRRWRSCQWLPESSADICADQSSYFPECTLRVLNVPVVAGTNLLVELQIEAAVVRIVLVTNKNLFE